MEIGCVTDDVPGAAVTTQPVVAVRWLHVVAIMSRCVVIITKILYLKKKPSNTVIAFALKIALSY